MVQPARETGARTGRVATGLFLVAVGWYLPFAAASTVLLPARLAALEPDGKALALGVVTGTAAVVALASNIVFGRASDRTRSRFGRRTPWIVAGGTAAGLALWGTSTAGSALAVGVWWSVFSVGLNAMLAPLLAVVADRVPSRSRGTVSALYGAGIIVGQVAGTVVGAGFLTDPAAGFRTIGLVLAVAALAFVLIAPDRAAEPPVARGIDARARKRPFGTAFAALADPDFRWVLLSRFALITAISMVLGFQLFVLTDHVGLDTAGAQQVLVLAGAVIGGSALLATLLWGPLSDRIGRRRTPILVAAVLVAVGACVPVVAPTVPGFLVFVALAAFGYGGYQAVDTALMTEVLPSPDGSGRDLGILNVASAGGQALGPGLVPVVLGVGGYGALFTTIALVAVASALFILPVRR